MTEQHPIKPPVELVQQWWGQAPAGSLMKLADTAAQWGADQELEACDDYVSEHTNWPTGFLTSAMRPKPPSLKEQALAVLDSYSDLFDSAHQNIIRSALEELPND